MCAQAVLGIFILRTNPGYEAFNWLGGKASRFLAYSDTGSAYVFGDSYMDHWFVFQVIITTDLSTILTSCSRYLVTTE